MASRFARVEARLRAGKFVFALLADLPRKSCWSIAEHAGDADPHGMQHLLNRAVWDADGVPRRPARARHRRARRHRRGAGGRRDRRSENRAPRPSGGQRQYTGTADRIKNAQVAVYLTYAGARGHAGTRARGHAMIDRELYLPRSWIQDPERLQRAGVPAEIEFATKPALATGMLIRAGRGCPGPLDGRR